MAKIQIEDLLAGVHSGAYPKQIGSQFGSIWEDGLQLQEASPEEYAEFNGPAGIRLCHGEPIEWLGRKWDVILVYVRNALSQINIHCANDGKAFEDLCAHVTAVMGSPNSASAGRSEWAGTDAGAIVTQQPEFVQLSLGKYTFARRAASKVLGFLGIKSR